MYFAVSEPISILGKTYKPCICYECPTFMLRTVRELADKGKVTIFTERQFFCNGKIISTKLNKLSDTVKKASRKKEVESTPKEEPKETHEQDVELPDEIDESVIEGF